MSRPVQPAPSTPPTDWRHELELVDQLMRDVSRVNDPQELVKLYVRGVRRLFPLDHNVTVSRRGVTPPWYRITRSSRWAEEINPWSEPEKLPILRGGLLGELFDANKPQVLEQFEVAPDDPAAEYFTGMRALMTLPQYDDGVALNMTVLMWDDPAKIHYERVATTHWQGNLFGRATLNMVLRRQLSAAHEAIDRDLRVVGAIQRSLLPSKLPAIPGLDLAAHYSTAQRAGGDYYDIFPLPNGAWGFFIADVSGHGTPAAVMMAVTHALAHTQPGPPTRPGEFLARLNDLLTTLYTHGMGTFVTAFYGIYTPGERSLTFASAGHNPPRWRRAGPEPRVRSLDGIGGLPLGIRAQVAYPESTAQLQPGDLVLLYTDGITEAADYSGRLFGEQRLDQLLAAKWDPAVGVAAIVENIETAVNDFSAGRSAADDRTVLAIGVRSS